MKHLYKLLFFFAILFYNIVNAQPPTPPGGGGGVTPGAPASPIDDYIIYLAIVAMFVIYYTFKKSNRLVKN